MYDSQWRQRWAWQDSKLTIETTQDPATRRAILERNQALRNEQPLRDLSFGRLQLCIPIQDHAELCQRNPALKSYDKAEREKAWRDFARSAESLPYRVQ